MIYLDNAATSYPKPKAVLNAMTDCMKHFSANPGRSAHSLSIKASSALYEARETVADLLQAQAEDCAFTLNCTDSLSTAILGVLKPGSHVITTVFEHNSVLRPLEHLCKQGIITYDCAQPIQGVITLECIKRLKKSNTAMVIINHISNVCGVVCDPTPIYAYCKENGILLCLDAAQSAGNHPVNAQMADILCMAGHKGLQGPLSSGILYIRPGLDVMPLRFGGTGSQSDSLAQPEFRPDRYESGTLPLPAIWGLKAGIEEISSKITEIGEKERHLAQMLTDGLKNIPQVKLYSPDACQSGVVLFNVGQKESGQISHRLDKEYGIATRPGYHCAPLAHRYLGTAEQGGVRLSIGYKNTARDIQAVLRAMERIVKSEI